MHDDLFCWPYSQRSPRLCLQSQRATWDPVPRDASQPRSSFSVGHTGVFAVVLQNFLVFAASPIEAVESECCSFSTDKKEVKSDSEVGIV